MNGITIVASNDIWAVGERNYHTLTMHWDGLQWTIFPSPNPSGDDALLAVASTANNDVWAVGFGEPDGSNLIVHWDGGAWSLVPNPTVPTYSALEGVAALRAGGVWAVGLAQGSQQSLIEHYGPVCPTPTPTPCPSSSAMCAEQPVLHLHPLPGLPGHRQRLQQQPALRRRALLPAGQPRSRAAR